jgi:hypothetical protein
MAQMLDAFVGAIEPLRSRLVFLGRAVLNGIAHVGHFSQRDLIVGGVVVLALFGVALTPSIVLGTRVPLVALAISVVSALIVDGAYIEWHRARRGSAVSGETDDEIRWLRSQGTIGAFDEQWDTLLVRKAQTFATGLTFMNRGSDLTHEEWKTLLSELVIRGLARLEHRPGAGSAPLTDPGALRRDDYYLTDAGARVVLEMRRSSQPDNEQRQAAAAFRFELESNLSWLDDIAESMIYLRDEAWVRMKNEGYVSYLTHPIPMQVIGVYDRLQRLNRKLKVLREGDSSTLLHLTREIESSRDELREKIIELIGSFDAAYPDIGRNFKRE